MVDFFFQKKNSFNFFLMIWCIGTLKILSGP